MLYRKKTKKKYIEWIKSKLEKETETYVRLKYIVVFEFLPLITMLKLPQNISSENKMFYVEFKLQLLLLHKM